MILNKATVKKYLKGCADVNEHVIAVFDTPEGIEAKTTLERLRMYDTLGKEYTSHNTVKDYLMDAWELPPVRIDDTEIEVEKGFVYLTYKNGDMFEKYVSMAEFSDKNNVLFNKYMEEYKSYFKEIYFC